MPENIQKGFLNELIEIVKLIAIFAIRKLNFQHGLYFTAFLTFGIGDGVTAAYMMEKLGAGSEVNPMLRYVFMENGMAGMVSIKIWLTLSLLFAAYIVSIKSRANSFWTVNGFLIALSAGGVMSINANLNALNGLAHDAPEEIIVIFAALTLILIEIGSIIDRENVK